MCGNFEATQVNAYLAPGKGGSAKNRNMLPSVVPFSFCLLLNLIIVSSKIDFLHARAESRTSRIMFTFKNTQKNIFTMFTFQNCASLVFTFFYIERNILLFYYYNKIWR